MAEKLVDDKTDKPDNTFLLENLTNALSQILLQQKPNNASHDGFASAMTIKLDGNNFYLWSQMLKMKLAGRDKLGYIDGTNPQIDENYRRWLVDDSIVKDFLINSMDSSLIGNFFSYSTAKEVWDTVCTTYFNGNDLSQILDLKRKINQIKQMGESIESYYTQLQGLWKELDIRRPNPMEHPGDIEKYKKLVQEDRVLVFLDGLDNRLDHVRARVLEKVMLNQEETNNSMVMLARELTMNKPSYYPKPNYNQNTKPNNLEGCTYCHNPKHTKDKIYKLIGYPEWWKDPRKKKQGEHQP